MVDAVPKRENVPVYDEIGELTVFAFRQVMGGGARVVAIREVLRLHLLVGHVVDEFVDDVRSYVLYKIYNFFIVWNLYLNMYGI